MSARPPAEATARDRGRAAGILGLARRAGRAVVGTEAVRSAAASGDLRGVVMASDAADNARERVRKALRDAGVPVWEWADRDRLGAVVGRGPVVVVGVTDPGLAGRLQEILEQHVPAGPVLEQ